MAQDNQQSTAYPTFTPPKSKQYTPSPPVTDPRIGCRHSVSRVSCQKGCAGT